MRLVSGERWTPKTKEDFEFLFGKNFSQQIFEKQENEIFGIYVITAIGNDEEDKWTIEKETTFDTERWYVAGTLNKMTIATFAETDEHIEDMKIMIIRNFEKFLQDKIYGKFAEGTLEFIFDDLY